jgi:aminoglycoside phosphotransferase (APT) family kinase protein
LFNRELLQYHDWARGGRRSELIERGLRQLHATWPREGRTVLSWGDVRIGNIIYRNFEPVACWIGK